MADSKLPESQTKSTTPNDTGYIPGDDLSTQCRNIFAIMMGKMSDEGKEQFRTAKDIRNEAADCKRCEDQRDYLLKYSEWLSATIRHSSTLTMLNRIRPHHPIPQR
jgi:inner membrane protease ATP23